MAAWVHVFLTCKDQMLSSPPIPPDTRASPLEQNESDFTAVMWPWRTNTHFALSCCKKGQNWMIDELKSEAHIHQNQTKWVFVWLNPDKIVLNHILRYYQNQAYSCRSKLTLTSVLLSRLGGLFFMLGRETAVPPCGSVQTWTEPFWQPLKKHRQLNENVWQTLTSNFVNPVFVLLSSCTDTLLRKGAERKRY